jgi:hypothetical protein
MVGIHAAARRLTTYTGSDAMLFLHLRTSFADFLTSAVLAHHLGCQAGLLPFSAELIWGRPDEMLEKPRRLRQVGKAEASPCKQ